MERAQMEEIQSGQKPDKRFEGKDGRDGFISRGGPNGQSSTVEVYKLKEFEEEVTVLAGVRSSEEAGTQPVKQLQK